MKLYRFVVVSFLFFFFLSSVEAQDARHVVHDWSNRHVIFTSLTPKNVAAADADPRQRRQRTWVSD
jgi:hypothetical protein